MAAVTGAELAARELDTHAEEMNLSEGDTATVKTVLTSKLHQTHLPTAMARSHIYAAAAAAITQNVHLPLLRLRYAGTIFLHLLPLLLLLLLLLPLF